MPKALLMDPSLVELPEPKSIAEVEGLVHRLYLLGSPHEISRIQCALQKIQRSPQGWHLADALLHSQDTNVRFFGALTFNIKIHKDWVSLEENATATLLDRLLSWLLQLTVVGESPLVIRKLCSALVAYTLQPSSTWNSCVRHLLCCFFKNTIVSSDEVSHLPPTAQISQQLATAQFVSSLWFIVTLVEEVGKMDPDSVQSNKYHMRAADNLHDIVDIIRQIINPETGDKNLVREGINCYHAVVMYAHRAWMDKVITLDSLRTLAPQVIKYLGDLDTFDVVLEFLTDVLANFPIFFVSDDYSLIVTILCSPMAQQYISGLQAGDYDTESVAFGRMLLAFSDAKVQDLARYNTEPSTKVILSHLLNLLRCDGYAVVEDEICSQALEFWTTFVEYLIDALFADTNSKPNWMDEALQYVVRALEACWEKIRVPPPEIGDAWDAEARSGFRAFRNDVEDVIQSSYTLLGTDILRRFTQLALDSLGIRAWYKLEATLFCINALSDVVSDLETSDESLFILFTSSLFSRMASEATAIPMKTKQTVVASISRYTSFFERHTEYLPLTLNFLFSAVVSPALANVVSKAILSMCSSCRKSLVSELGIFVQQYGILVVSSTLEPTTKERLIGAVASIVQAVTPEEDQLNPLDQLVRFVEHNVREFLELLQANRTEDAQMTGLGVLNSLISMGKGLQVPDDVVIDLDADRPPSSITIWEQDTGLSIQARIIRCIGTIFNSMRYNGDIVEATCHILRTGYTELYPGPFVFPSEVTKEILVSSELGSARLGYVLDTAGVMLSRKPSEAMDHTALHCLSYLASLVNEIRREPNEDPELASSCIDFAHKMTINYLKLFSAPEVPELRAQLFQFILVCLTGTEILPKRSAANFWSSFIQTSDLSPETQSLVDDVLQEYGPLLCRTLINQIGGDAARSELDVLAAPLKKLIVKQPLSKKWLSEAIFSIHFPSKLVKDAEKRMWLQKVINLRGARGTNLVVRDFWMACRGTSLAFAS